MKLVGKGTVAKIEIATVLTAIAQVISIDLPEQKMETFESDSLDNTDAGIPHQATGRTDRGEIGMELFFDPGLASHSAFTTWLDDPTPEEKDAQIIFTSSPAKTWQFDNTPGCSLGGKVAMNDGVKATVKIRCNKLLTIS